VKAIFDEYGLKYTTGPLPLQVASAWAKVIRLSLPNDFAAKLTSGFGRARSRQLASA
jgi:linoleoyl-CoA desaturase